MLNADLDVPSATDRLEVQDFSCSRARTEVSQQARDVASDAH
jgi:hypothetical protein